MEGRGNIIDVEKDVVQKYNSGVVPFMILKLAMITLYFGRGAAPNLGHFFGIPTQRPQSDFQLFSYSI